VTRKALDVAKAAAGSSTGVRVGRPIVEGSAVCAAIASVVQLLQRAGGSAASSRLHRSAVEAAAAGHRLDVVVAGSRVVALLSSAVQASSLAQRDARAVRVLEPLLSLDLVNTIRVMGYVALIAVITHTLLLAVLRVAVHEAGWAMRAALVAASAIVMRWPEPFAAAWQDRISTHDIRRL
jgi:hypothetical protein